MNRKYYSALAVSAATVGMVLLGSTEASAQLRPDPLAGQTSEPARTVPNGWPDEAKGHPAPAKPQSEPNYPNYDPTLTQATTQAAAMKSNDNTGTEVLQSGASALGGAAVALGCVWLYRRHQLRTT